MVFLDKERMMDNVQQYYICIECSSNVSVNTAVPYSGLPTIYYDIYVGTNMAHYTGT
jgi:hypothetical protein